MNFRNSSNNDGPDDWITTYSDMVTLLLAFFVLLFSFSSVDAVKWQALVGSFKGEVNFIGDANSGSILEDDFSIVDKDQITIIDEKEEEIPGGIGGERIEADFRALYQALTSYNKEKGLNMEVTMLGKEIRIRLANNLLFDSAKADLNRKANETLLELTDIIKDYDDILDKLILEGHTDNLPIRTANFRDNFELSLERALNVLYYFKYQGDFASEKLIAMGYGEHDPVATNETVEGRSKNRRTDILLTRTQG